MDEQLPDVCVPAAFFLTSEWLAHKQTLNPKLNKQRQLEVLAELQKGDGSVSRGSHSRPARL